jgi:hypothetical protein
MADVGVGPWGEAPTFHAPCFLVTNRPAETVVKKGGTSYIFVTDVLSRTFWTFCHGRKRRTTTGDLGSTRDSPLRMTAFCLDVFGHLGTSWDEFKAREHEKRVRRVQPFAGRPRRYQAGRASSGPDARRGTGASHTRRAPRARSTRKTWPLGGLTTSLTRRILRPSRDIFGTFPRVEPRSGQQESLAERGFSNAPGEIRTPDLRFRRPTLYPAELRAPGRQV